MAPEVTSSSIDFAVYAADTGAAVAGTSIFPENSEANKTKCVQRSVVQWGIHCVNNNSVV